MKIKFNRVLRMGFTSIFGKPKLSGSEAAAAADKYMKDVSAAVIRLGDMSQVIVNKIYIDDAQVGPQLTPKQMNKIDDETQEYSTHTQKALEES